MSKFFCTYHSQRMRTCESEAVRYWREMMSRGLKSYTQCRIEAAIIYLDSAIDIVLLRTHCEQNNTFEIAHLIKPAELLIRLMAIEYHFDKAFNFLHRLSQLKVSSLSASQGDLLSFLRRQHDHIELAEREYMREKYPVISTMSTDSLAFASQGAHR